MSRLRIQGGRKIRGRLRVSGMKNAATPILAACLLTDEPCILHNVPRIRDVERMLDILRSMGAKAEWNGEHDLRIETRGADPKDLDRKAMRSIRSSVLMMGPMLARFREVELPEPGGCHLGNRPLDTHLVALERLGAECSMEGEAYRLTAKELVGRTVVLPEFSVTATENLMMAATLAKGRTVIKIAAAEPHVEDLGVFLRSMGAKIDGLGTHTITIDGVPALHGAEHHIIPDQIEAGTFLVAAAMMRGGLRVEDIRPDHLDIVIQKLESIGAQVEVGADWAEVSAPATLKAFKLQTMPYPGFPTDLMAPFGVLATQCSGTTLIHETMFDGRFGFIHELVKMGANAVISDPHRALITGPTPLYGKEIKSPDLRAGVTLVLAGLLADGETVIHEAEIIDRGYERIAERLRDVGADIVREE
jgi:UDP-N-acetylglucosamine 1-carboxyvinyltransferase